MRQAQPNARCHAAHRGRPPPMMSQRSAAGFEARSAKQPQQHTSDHLAGGRPCKDSQWQLQAQCAKYLLVLVTLKCAFQVKHAHET